MNSGKTVRLSEIQEVWESWHSWYWFVTEHHDAGLAFGLVKGCDIEWGYFDLNELRRLYKQSKVWKVPKRNWALCLCLIDDAALCSQESGILRHRWPAVTGMLPARGTVPRRVAQRQGAAKSDAGLQSLKS
jgi:hypothetical protein